MLVTLFNRQEKGRLSYVGAGKIVHLIVHDNPRLQGHELGESLPWRKEKMREIFTVLP